MKVEEEEAERIQEDAERTQEEAERIQEEAERIQEEAERIQEEAERIQEREAVAVHALIPYTQLPGNRAGVGEGRPIDFFKLFISSTMLQYIVAHTDFSADQHHESHDSPPSHHSRVRGWRRMPTSLLSSSSSLL